MINFFLRSLAAAAVYCALLFVYITSIAVGFSFIFALETNIFVKWLSGGCLAILLGVIVVLILRFINRKLGFWF